MSSTFDTVEKRTCPVCMGDGKEVCGNTTIRCTRCRGLGFCAPHKLSNQERAEWWRGVKRSLR